MDLARCCGVRKKLACQPSKDHRPHVSNNSDLGFFLMRRPQLLLPRSPQLKFSAEQAQKHLGHVPVSLDSFSCVNTRLESSRPPYCWNHLITLCANQIQGP